MIYGRYHYVPIRNIYYIILKACYFIFKNEKYIFITNFLILNKFTQNHKIWYIKYVIKIVKIIHVLYTILLFSLYIGTNAIIL